jgi:hypothetical protein
VCSSIFATIAAIRSGGTCTYANGALGARLPAGWGAVTGPPTIGRPWVSTVRDSVVST